MKRSFSGFVRAGWLIDGSGGPALKNRVVDIRNGTIRSIQRTMPTGSDRPEVLDLSEHTIMPALIDSHVHLFMSGTADQQRRKKQLDAGFDQIRPVIAKHINQHLACGVFAVRDGGDRQAHALRYKTGSFLEKRLPFDLKVAGKAWHKAGRYGRLIGRSPSDQQTLADAITKDRSTIDHVKIVNSGLNSLVKFGFQSACQFDIVELKNAVIAAHRRELSVMIHANGRVPVEVAIDAGCDSIEHGFFMGKKNMDMMAQSHIRWIPTTFTMKAFADHLDRTGQQTDIAARNLDHQLEQIRLAKDAGVQMVLGTDAGSIGVHHGRAVIEEMKLFMTAGLTIEQTVRCATHNGARLLDLKGAGRLSKNMAATFIATRGNPLKLPESLSAIEHMYVKGCRVTPGTRSGNELKL